MRILAFFLCLLCASARAEPTIAYLSDPEGNWDKFTSFFENHECFFTGADGKTHLKPDAQFVFGGDIPDRGPGTLRILQELIRLKSESGERVTFIVGNRDINKTRMRAELSEAHRKKTGRSAPDELRFIFERTMGSPKAFEFLREEIALLTKQTKESITDQQVVDRYLLETGPEGNFSKFLEQGKLAHRIGNTLFVHSGVTAEALGFVPGQPQKVEADVWIESLNKWYESEIKKWAATRDTWTGEGPRPGEPLIQYPLPKPGKTQTPESVLYGRNADAVNNLFLPPPEVIAALKALGIQRLVLGHTPTGQVPHILRSEGFEVVTADNSYAANERFGPRVTIKGAKGEILAIEATYLHPNGTTEPIHYSTELGRETPLGKRMADGSLIVAPVKEGYMTSKWRKIGDEEVRRRSMEEVQALGFRNPCRVFEMIESSRFTQGL